MPVYAARFEGGLSIQGARTQDEMIRRIAGALDTKLCKNYLYGVGRHDVTPSEYLWPAALQLLYINGDTAGKPTSGLLRSAAVDKHSRILMNPEDLFKENPEGALHSNMQQITVERPVIIAKSEVTDHGNIPMVLLMLYFSSQELPAEPPQPEKRREIIHDCGVLLAKQGELSEDNLITALQELGAFYANRHRNAIKSVLGELVKFGRISSRKVGTQTFYSLRSIKS